MDNGKIVNIDKNKMHSVAELICVRCSHRWIGVWKADTWLKELTCPRCSNVGTIICTGQILDISDEDIEKCNDEINYDDNKIRNFRDISKVNKGDE